MRDFARSESPVVQTQLDRLAALSVPQGRLGLETVRALLARLGDPQDRLPPVFHVAGTNGKGSTCAILRAMLEAQGYSVHATTSPHLVRYNERIRVAGKLISDKRLADVLAEVLDAGEDLQPSFFEVTIAAAFAEFARIPADACVVEVGLGGRFDATNVIARPAVCGIAALGIDHERFLLTPEEGVPTEPIARIAFEKAGIAKPGVPLVTLAYPKDATRAVIDQAMIAGARPALRDLDWTARVSAEVINYQDRQGPLTLPLPSLQGAHQADNAALAVAMLRHQQALPVSPESLAEGIRAARWPARLQLLGDGPLTRLLPEFRWLLDGGHNPDAAKALAAHFARGKGGPVHAIIGMLENKDWRGFLTTLAPYFDTLAAVPVPDHDYAPLPELASFARNHGTQETTTATDVQTAIDWLSKRRPPDARRGGTGCVGGSLYLAGEVLRLNGTIPD